MKAATSRPYNALPLVPADVLLDIVERVFILCTFTYFACRTHDRFLEVPDVRFALLICSEVIPLAFILVRPIAKTISRRPSDWMFAMAGSTLPLFITMATFDPLLPGAICYFVVLAGMALQLLAKIFLGLSFGVVAANRGVKIGGPYSYIRHPMYAGYTLTHVGLLLAMPSLENLFLYAGAFALQVIRMRREEATLLRDGKYREFSASVRYRLIPGLY